MQASKPVPVVKAESTRKTKKELLREVENIAGMRCDVKKRVLRAIVNEAANSIIMSP